MDRTAPDGRVLGIDIIPALPPKGASSMQGDFTSPRIQEEMKKFLANPLRGRPLKPRITAGEDAGEVKGVVEAAGQTYIEQERAMMKDEEEWATKTGATERAKDSVDVVLSDMLEPFLMVEGLSKMSLGRPYRLMTTSGNRLRDQVGSIVCSSPSVSISSPPYKLVKSVNGPPTGSHRDFATRLWPSPLMSLNQGGLLYASFIRAEIPIN